jgi:photosystem II stability/assembly factor-like uncharacterized protein
MIHNHLLLVCAVATAGSTLRLALLVSALGLMALPVSTRAQAKWEALPTGSNASFRGLSVVNDSVIWASGTRGTVLRSIDAGVSWQVDTVPGGAAMDLRAIHGISDRVAHVAATAGRIWRTSDGGRTWNLAYQARDTTVFLDGIVFADERFGLTLGDPMDGRFLILVTRDAGETWSEAPAPSRPPAEEGEAAFAASGTSLVMTHGRHAWLGTGGSVTRVYRSADRGSTWVSASPGMLQRAGSGGIFSLAFADSMHGVAVGGDYLKPDSTRGNAAYTTDGGSSWGTPVSTPAGYRSGVAMHRDGARLTAIAVGTTGTDISRDGGRTWTTLDATPFNAVQFAPSGVAYAAGARGSIARIDLRRLPR